MQDQRIDKGSTVFLFLSLSPSFASKHLAAEKQRDGCTWPDSQGMR
jgi:hypothetical protein